MSAINFKSIDYKIGYEHGYKDGHKTAYEQFKDALECRQVRYIVVTQEEFDKIKENGLVKKEEHND